MSVNKDMGDAHEKLLHEVLGGRQTRGSGNQWANPIDGRHNHLTEDYAFAWDGKSTLAKSISISRSMWDKAVEQALGERPMLGLRFYDNERLKVYADLVALSLYDFSEVLEDARRYRALVKSGEVSE